MEPENPTVPTPPQPKKNNLAVILLSILLLVTLSATVYLFLQVQKLSREIAGLQIQVQVTPTPFPETPRTDPTADWKTYTDTQNKFSFNYPTSWKNEANCHGSSATEKYFCLSSPDLATNPIGVVEKGEQILVYTQSDGSLGVGYGPEDFCSPEKRETKVTCQKIQVNKESGIKAVFSSFENSFEDAGILKNNIVSLVFRAEFNKESKNATQNTLTQILSTFLFLDNGN